ncbi:hypothetical protein AB836_00940 [Rickettsiales bacterium (ex Bugula neritina AB1)]|nr:hypothetical protein AB836_00940 [Rickettsiales bacterium (ex Bugula neritina AB1)]
MGLFDKIDIKMSTINNIITKIEETHIKELGFFNRWKSFKVGDNIEVILEVLSRDKKNIRFQRVNGRCIGIRKPKSTGSTFKVLDLDTKITYIFPLYSPDVNINVKTSGESRKAKLNYLKHKSRKNSRIKIKKK